MAGAVYGRNVPGVTATLSNSTLAQTVRESQRLRVTFQGGEGDKVKTADVISVSRVKQFTDSRGKCVYDEIL